MPLAEGPRVAEDALDLGLVHAATVSCRNEERVLKVHDVTLTLRPGMTTWGDQPGFTVTPLRRIAKGDSANVSLISLGDHTGTHVDPPIHFIEGASTVDKLPVDALLGPCLVLEHTDEGDISGEWLERARIPSGAMRLLSKFGSLTESIAGHVTDFPQLAKTSVMTSRTNGSPLFCRTMFMPV